MNPGAPQDFIHVDIAQAGEESLIKEQWLQHAAVRSECGV
jgi:hypothetical protein